jgi:prepilin-type N-terminal cleavage/methylation domain-containing protein
MILLPHHAESQVNPLLWSAPARRRFSAARCGMLRSNARAFTLVELLVTITLMTVIILALYAVFNQTQKALRASITQVDVLEGGRATMQMIARDLEQLAYPRQDGIDLFSRYTYSAAAPLIQPLDASSRRTNFFQELFFLTRSNRFWLGNAYYVAAHTNSNIVAQKPPLVGTLYRFSAPNHTNDVNGRAWPASTMHLSPLHQANLLNQFTLATQGKTDFSKYVSPVLNGVIHCRWLEYDALGNLITNRTIFLGKSIGNRVENINPPAYIEIELAVLETQAFEQYKSFPDPAMARQFLERQAGKVHLFRQRVPIRIAE